jgi:hypothetical protein
MRPQSAKAKGRNLQKWVVSQLLSLFPSLSKDDVSSRSMGSGGEDVLISPAARVLFPYSVECKARKSLKTIYDWLAQANANANGYAPIVVIKQNHSEPLVILGADVFFKLVKKDEI